jgi:hypothetical protein
MAQLTEHEDQCAHCARARRRSSRAGGSVMIYVVSRADPGGSASRSLTGWPPRPVVLAI